MGQISMEKPSLPGSTLSGNQHAALFSQPDWYTLRRHLAEFVATIDTQ
jgi:hypothetical protein